MHPCASLVLVAVAFLVATAHGRLLIFYPLNETSGTQANDFSGNGKNARYMGGPQLGGANGVRLDGNDDYVLLPSDLMRGLTSLTVSIEVRIRPEQTGNYFIFGLGNTGANGDGNGYVFATGNPLRAAISPSDWHSEAEVRAANALPRDVWKTITFVVDGNANSITLYLDGASLGGRTNSGTIVTPASIGSGASTSNYIGRSTYTQDRFLSGSVRNFRLWDAALSASEVANPASASTTPPPTGGNPVDRIASALLTLSIPDMENIRGNVNLPSAWEGLPVTWTSNQPSIISNDGVVRRPTAADVDVVLVAKLTYQSYSGERSFTLTVRKSDS